MTLRRFYFRSGDDGCIEPFSALNKLNTLIIRYCRVLNEQILCISSATLVNLTMYGIYDYQHKCRLELSAPSLSNFAFTGSPYQKLYVRHPRSVTRLYIDTKLIGFSSTVPAVLVSWLLELVNIKSLTVSSNTLQVLSIVHDLFKVKPTSLFNLDSLRVEMKPLTPDFYMILRHDKFMNEFGAGFHLKKAKFIPNGVVEFLLQNSPLANVNIIDNDD